MQGKKSVSAMLTFAHQLAASFWKFVRSLFLEMGSSDPESSILGTSSRLPPAAETSGSEPDRRRSGFVDTVIVHKESGSYLKIDSSNLSSAFDKTVVKNIRSISRPFASQKRQLFWRCFSKNFLWRIWSSFIQCLADLYFFTFFIGL